MTSDDEEKESDLLEEPVDEALDEVEDEDAVDEFGGGMEDEEGKQWE